MKLSSKTMIIVLVSIMSQCAVLKARADDISIIGRIVNVLKARADDISVTGRIVNVYRDSSIIVIAQEGEKGITIHGFPFGNLEAQLTETLDPLAPDEDSITIEVDDCVTVEYSKKDILRYVFNKFESLTKYCEECTTTEPCYGDDALVRKPQKTNWPNCGG